MACAGNNGRADVGESGSSEAGDVGVDVSAFVLAAQIQQRRLDLAGGCRIRLGIVAQHPVPVESSGQRLVSGVGLRVALTRLAADPGCSGESTLKKKSKYSRCLPCTSSSGRPGMEWNAKCQT